jgi:hypothetical protein
MGNIEDLAEILGFGRHYGDRQVAATGAALII